MSPRSIRSVVARVAIITGLAAMLFSGAAGLTQPREASARPSIYNVYCMMGDTYMQMADDAYQNGNPALGAHYREVAVGYLQHC